jgi:transcriptional regulator with XRE-family HTH domain
VNLALDLFDMLSDRIKQLRKERNLSQQQLARLIGVSQGCIGNWESGHRSVPTGKNLAAIAHAFNIDVETLLNRVSHESIFSIQESQLLATFRELTPDLRETAIRLVKALRE